ncbi:MAG: 4-(cytidine 5'-diphospho)-2-C-methyl-D-erythritol kinase, partial [Chloroflexi bacterium]
MSRAVVLAAPAKVNLTLEVLARRPDGYRELASVFATVDVRDRVRVAPSRVLDVRVSPDVGAAVEDELATRAVRALAQAHGRPPAAHVRIAKRIPVAAGLGGGSSDAGAVLRGLARIWRLDGVDLCAVGAGIGSDVPFFASGAAFALVTGRGERIEPLPSPQASLWVALVRIRARVATAAVFARYRGSRAAAHDSAALSEAFRNGGATPDVVRAHLMNDLLATAED